MSVGKYGPNLNIQHGMVWVAWVILVVSFKYHISSLCFSYMKDVMMGISRPAINNNKTSLAILSMQPSHLSAF